LEQGQNAANNEINSMKKIIEKRNEKLAGTVRYRILDFVVYAVFVMLLALAIRAVVFEPVRVDGSSMLSTLENDDYMLVDKLCYSFHPPRRGDIVILFYPEHTENTYVKRVMGLPGETIRIEGGIVYIGKVRIEDGIEYIDETPLDEPYLDEDRIRGHNYYGEYSYTPIPEGEIFVLGDNRGPSRDSTVEGTMKIERVIGRVRAVVYPFDHAKFLFRPGYTLP